MDLIEAAPSQTETFSGALDERILVLAPTGDDAALMSRVLRDRGLNAVVVDDLRALADALEAGAGVALIASEAFDDVEGNTALQHVLERQEAWSEMPILLFGGTVEDAASRATELVGARAQIVLLERPLGIATFVSATETALYSKP